MKKVLFATTALIATAGMAAADVKISGYGRFGAVYTGEQGVTAKQVQDAADQLTDAENALDLARGDMGFTADVIDGTIGLASISLADDYLKADDRASEREIKDAYDIIDYFQDNNAQAIAVGKAVALAAAGDHGIAEANVVFRFDPKTGEATALDTTDAGYVAGATDLTFADAQKLSADGAAHQAAWNAWLAEVGAKQVARAVASSIDLHTRLRMNFDVSGETDGGAVFGARFRVQGQNNGTAVFNGAQLYVSFGGLKLSAGNVCGAIECMPGLYAGSLGLTGLTYNNVVTNFDGNNWVHDAYSSTGGGINGVQIDYSVGNLSVAASYSDNTGNLGVVAQYSVDDATFAIGIQDGDTAKKDLTVATIGYNMGAAKIGIAYADNNGNAKWTLSTNVDAGAATSVQAYVTDDEAASDTGFGVGVRHDLGGGAALQGGMVRHTAGYTVADFGITFNF